jgi:hypothetical protein|tara:strand:+ start:383 stop:571 length:189 start_codon:yes stop_codon:yes gene_type:complete
LTKTFDPTLLVFQLDTLGTIFFNTIKNRSKNDPESEIKVQGRLLKEVILSTSCLMCLFAGYT